MKKFAKIFVCVLVVAAFAVMAFACNGDSGNENNDKKPVAEPHEITVSAPDGVDVTTSASSATEGVVVTVTVDAPAWYEVTGVTAGDATCTSGADGYTFTMPDEDVEVVVTVADSGVDVNEADGMTWVTAPSQIAPNSYNSQYFEVSFGNTAVTNTITQEGMSNVRVVSTNQAVIPEDAISGVDSTNDGASAFGAVFGIDLSQVAIGSTTLIFTDTQHDRTIAKYVTVCEAGTIQPERACVAELTIQFNDIVQDADLGDFTADNVVVLISVNDQDYIYGTDPEYGKQYAQQRFVLSSEGSHLMNVSILKDHSYTVNASLWGFEEGEDPETAQLQQLYTGQSLKIYNNVNSAYSLTTATGNSVSMEIYDLANPEILISLYIE